MPERYRGTRREDAVTLSDAHELGYLVRASCHLCSIRRVYDPCDLRQLAGNVGIRSLERRMRCERCDETENMEVGLWYPTAQERVGLRIRRLAGVKMVRKIIWRDEG